MESVIDYTLQAEVFTRDYQGYMDPILGEVYTEPRVFWRSFDSEEILENPEVQSLVLHGNYEPKNCPKHGTIVCLRKRIHCPIWMSRSERIGINARMTPGAGFCGEELD